MDFPLYKLAAIDSSASSSLSVNYRNQNFYVTHHPALYFCTKQNFEILTTYCCTSKRVLLG